MRLITLTLLFLFASTSWAGSAIEYLLKADTPPYGVVFEVVESDDEALEWAIPQIRDYVRQLRERYPAISISG